MQEYEERSLLQLSSLTRQSINSSNIEKQKVGLALNVFSEKTSADTKTSSISNNSMKNSAAFIDLVIELWKVFNGETTYGHHRQLDHDMRPIDLSVSGQRQLQTLSDWAERVKRLEPISSPRISCLTKDTARAIFWTCKCFIALAHYLLNTTASFRHNYIALGFFQQDNIEKHFAHFRMSSCCIITLLRKM